MAVSSVALSIAANASLVGAKTVMSLALLRVSPSFAAVTAVTRVERTGLFEAAVATGALAMPAKLPSPVAGTAEQAAPNWPSVIAAALPDGAADRGQPSTAAMDGAIDGGRGRSGWRRRGGRRGAGAAGAGAGSDEGDGHDEAGKGPGASALVHVFSPVWWSDPTGWPVPLGLVDRPARDRPDDVCVTGQVTVMTTECQPVAPSGNGVARVLRSALRRWRRSRGPRACACRALRPIRGPTGARCRWCRRRRGGPRPMGRRRPGPRPCRCRGAAPRRRRRWRSCRRAPGRSGLGASMRDIVLIGRFLDPAALDPVRVVRVERGQLEVDQPLAGRDVAVQAGTIIRTG